MSNRRSFLQSTLGLGAAWLTSTKAFAQVEQNPKIHRREIHPESAFNMPVVTTDIGDLRYTMDGDTKVFHLVAEVVKQQIHPSGMPAFGDPGDNDLDSWKLVAYIRHLPQLSDQEEMEMEAS